jgi:hypothetical protein
MELESISASDELITHAAFASEKSGYWLFDSPCIHTDR